jgi:nitroreductase
MEALKCIKSRRSKRKFLDKKIPDDLITEIIEAGKCAPSSHDCQPWQFYIIRDKKLKEHFAEIGYEENKLIVLSCDFILLICVDKERSPSRFIEDGVLAAQNMALAIHDLGLGSVYLSAYKPDDVSREKEIQNLFAIPAKNMPICMLLVGYPDPSEKLDNKILSENNDLIEYR